MAINLHSSISPGRDVTPEADVPFLLNFGKNMDNEMGLIFRHAWENQNVDVHQGTLVRVMTALMNWKASQGIGTYKSNQAYVKLKDVNGRGVVEVVNTIMVELKDFDIIANENFKGLTNDKRAAVNPKTYLGSPLMVNLRLYNLNMDIYKTLINVGYFYIKGDGDVDYVRYIHPVTMENMGYGIITDFRVTQLCFRNHVDGVEQILFE